MKVSPLMEQKKNEVVSESLKAEEKVKSSWFVLDLDGSLTQAEQFDYSKWPQLKKFADYEIRKARAYAEEPPHVALMKEHELVDYEPASDSGHFRWYPKGAFIKRQLENAVTQVVQNYGGLEVETPIMYDYAHPALSKYLHRFPARQYTVESDDKEFFLRFAACFGQYMIMHDTIVSYKDLPLRFYELTHYSFRREQSGEVAGLKRLRAFTMPDMHSLVADLDQARAEFKAQFKLCVEWMKSLKLDYEVGIRFEKAFFEENKGFALELVKEIGRPFLLEMWPERIAYFSMKFEFNVIDNADKASALSTVQIDVENAERFGIKYTSADGKEKLPFILHASISGSIDRNVYALLEDAAMKVKKNEKPTLPLWLCPTQVRFVPITEKHVGFCNTLSDTFEKQKIRADVDDRNERMQKKVAEAEREWIPYIVVVGDKEIESGDLTVRLREQNNSQEKIRAQDLITEISKRTQGFPYRKLPLPVFLSRRPVFHK